MHVISFRRLREFYENDSNTKSAIQDWYKTVRKSEWKKFSDIKNCFNSADVIGNNRIVFNIKGNHYRIVAIVLFQIGRVCIRWIGNHRDYDGLESPNTI